jgi:hypothetical protein
MKEDGEIDFVAEDLEDLRRIKTLAILHKSNKHPLILDPVLLTEEDRVILDCDCRVINLCKKGKIPKQISIEDAKNIQG